MVRVGALALDVALDVALGVALALGLAGTSGCSLLLDFDGEGGPADAGFSQLECDYKEPNNAPAEAAVFDPAEVGPAAICGSTPDDRDLYRFTVPMGTASVSVRVSFVNRPGGDLDLRVTDATGATTYGQSRGFENEELVVCPGSSPVCPTLGPGDYIFEVFPATPGAVNRYDIALTFTAM